MTSGGLLGVWGKWVKHAKYIYNIQDFNPEQVLDRTCVRMEAAEVVYENLMHRNKRSILVIISNAAAIDRMKKRKRSIFIRIIINSTL